MDHITVVFTISVKEFTYDCPNGHEFINLGGSETVAYCLCGWWFVAPFDLASGPASLDIAHTMAKMKAADHVQRAQEGVIE